jgi:hypothetical protein
MLNKLILLTTSASVLIMMAEGSQVRKIRMGRRLTQGLNSMVDPSFGFSLSNLAAVDESQPGTGLTNPPPLKPSTTPS